MPDYRSAEGTVLNTGPGQWEEKDTKGLSFEQYINRPNSKGYKRIETIKALPTVSHMALAKLLNVQFVREDDQESSSTE